MTFRKSKLLLLLPVISLAVFAITSAPSPLRAEPLDLKSVDADAKWLAHIDFDAGKATRVGLKVYEQWLSHGFAQESLQEVRRTVGLDLLEDVRGITFYSTRFERFGGVVVIRAKIDRPRLEQILDDNATHETSQYGEHELHTWVQEVEGIKSEVSGCFYRPALVVLARKTSDLKSALDVLDGKKPNLADSPSALNRSAAAGTVFSGGVIGLGDLAGENIPFVSPVIRYCRSMLLDLGEDGDQVFLQVRLYAKTPQNAAKLCDVIKGFAAMTQLEQADDAILVSAIDALNIKLQGDDLSIGWRMTGADAMRLLENQWKKQIQNNRAK